MPYYDQDGITIYHGDCRDVLPTLDAWSVNLVLTDPPFNAGMDYGAGQDDRRPWPEYVEDMARLILEMERVCSGMVMVFLSIRAALKVSARYEPRWVGAWTKPLGRGRHVGGSPFQPHWEPCLIYGRLWGEGGRVPPYTLPDVWNVNPSAGNGHPCAKPEALLNLIVGQITAPVILDPFCGSGTTLVAAKKFGRRAIGIEIEERYCEIAVKRLAQGVLL